MNLEIIGKINQPHSFPIYKFQLNEVEDIRTQQENFIKVVKAIPKVELFAEVFNTSVLPLQANNWHTINSNERSTYTLIHCNELPNHLKIKFKNNQIVDIKHRDCILYSSIISPKLYSDVNIDVFISTCFIYYQYENELPETLTAQN